MWASNVKITKGNTSVTDLKLYLLSTSKECLESSGYHHINPYNQPFTDQVPQHNSSIINVFLVVITFSDKVTSYVFFIEGPVSAKLLNLSLDYGRSIIHDIAERDLFKIATLHVPADAEEDDVTEMILGFQQTQETLHKMICLKIENVGMETQQKPKSNTENAQSFESYPQHEVTSSSMDRIYTADYDESQFDPSYNSESDRESECDFPFSKAAKREIFKSVENLWNANKSCTTDESEPLDTCASLHTISESTKVAADKQTISHSKEPENKDTQNIVRNEEISEKSEYNGDDLHERITQLESLMNQQLRLRSGIIRKEALSTIENPYIGDDALLEVRKEIRMLREQLSKLNNTESFSSSLDTSKDTSSSHPSISSLRVSQVSSSTERESASNLLSSLEDIRNRVNALKEPPRRHRRHRKIANDSDRTSATTVESQVRNIEENQWVSASDFFSDSKQQSYAQAPARTSDIYSLSSSSSVRDARPSDIFLRRDNYNTSNNNLGRASDANLLSISRSSHSQFTKAPLFTSHISDKFSRNSNSTAREQRDSYSIRVFPNLAHEYTRDMMSTDKENMRTSIDCGAFRESGPSEPLHTVSPAVSRPIAVNGPKYSPQVPTQGTGTDVRADGELWQRKGRLVKFWRRRFVAILPHSVFGSVLCIFEMEKNQTLQPTKSKMLALKQTQVKSEANTVVIAGKARYVFCVQTATTELYFAAADAKTRHYWLEKLRFASK
eukprot:jgi/Galph1/110/GphlegSOOS_G4869.1